MITWNIVGRQRRKKGSKKMKRRSKKRKGEKGGREIMRDAHLEYCGVLEAKHRENILVDK